MTPPLFIFGTLCHFPLLDAVIGDSAHLTFEQATLPDFSLTLATGGQFPVIEVRTGAQADGLLVRGLTHADLAALDFYEAIFDYRRHVVVLSGGQTAEAYLPPAGRWQGKEAWDLDAWVQTWAEISLRAAREVMGYRATKTPQEIAGIFPLIRARAASAINAQSSRHGARTLNGEVKVIAQRRPYSKFFALDEYDLRHERFDRSFSPPVTRAVFRAPDAALVLPYDAACDRVLLVEQLRMGPMARGDTALWQLEPVAGRMDAGEGAEAAARREAMEEAGLELGTLHPVGEAYCSPGNSSEFFYMFVGEADLADASTRLGGLSAEDEDIRSHVLSFEEMMAMCDRFELANAPLLILAFWLARHRDRLRAAARG